MAFRVRKLFGAFEKQAPGTTITPATKPKLQLKSLDISTQDLQFYERLGEFFRGNSTTIPDCRVSSIKSTLKDVKAWLKLICIKSD